MVADELFALLLAGLIAVRFRRWLKYSPPVSAADIRLFSRRLSRTVYLLLYLIIGAEQIVNIVGRLKDEGMAPPDLAMLKPTNQVFLLYGLIALVLIRVLAYLTWRRISISPRARQRGSLLSQASDSVTPSSVLD
jgi:hypothetical protein